ncbi:MAG: iron-sulfur cluster repair di-iron protein [Candidatus Riflebacteria bacterium]|nr:iron-sulfur cluster repair di-iron protein [Candidatus Riflebacteria bacterium]
MKNVVSMEMTVRELVARRPKVRPVLEQLGVDYCCGGGRSLADAARDTGVDAATLIRAVEEAIAAPEPAGRETRDWSIAPITELVDHIQNRHHAYLRRELPRVAELLGKVRRVHGAHHGQMLEAVAARFEPLSVELEAHLAKEEQVLFPYFRKLDLHASGRGARPASPGHGAPDLVRELEQEHDGAGAAIHTIARLTSSYRPPADACPTFRALIEGLKALEDDLHEHVHLENNILYPSALELERPRSQAV